MNTRKIFPAIFLASASVAVAATITVPTDPFGGSNGDVKDGLIRSNSTTSFAPLRWSYDDPAFAKPFDPDGDNKWGSSGYVMFANNGATLGIITVASADNVFDTLLSSDIALPPFVGSITFASSGTVQMPNPAVYDERLDVVGDLAYSTRAGAHKIDAAEMTETIGSYIYGDALTITIVEDAQFTLGVHMDFLAGTANNLNTGERAILTDGVSSATSLGYGPTSTGNISDANPDMVFFDVDAQAGDTLTLKIGNTGAVDTYYHGITFDAVTATGGGGSFGYVTLVPGGGTATANFTLLTTDNLANPFTAVDSADILSVSESAGVISTEFNTGAASQLFLRVEGSN